MTQIRPGESGANASRQHGGKGHSALNGTHALSYEALLDIIDLSLWAGQMLLQYGASSERVEETVHRIGTGLGCDWLDIDVSLHAITITAISGEDFRTKIRRVIPRGVNFKIVTAVNDLGRSVAEGQLDRFQARAALQLIDREPPGYSTWLVFLAVCIACGAFSRLFGGDWVAFVTTLVATFVGMLLRQVLQRRYFNPYLIVIATAFSASLVAGVTDLFLLSSTPGVAIIASVLFLVPGVSLINSAQDLMRGYVDNGVSRGVEGLMISLSIGIGVFFALSLTGLRLP